MYAKFWLRKPKGRALVEDEGVNESVKLKCNLWTYRVGVQWTHVACDRGLLIALTKRRVI
jgi:hypothetical protein